MGLVTPKSSRSELYYGIIRKYERKYHTFESTFESTNEAKVYQQTSLPVLCPSASIDQRWTSTNWLLRVWAKIATAESVKFEGF